MRYLLAWIFVFLTTLCFAQTQDIYIHNSNNYWENVRHEKEKETERLRQLDELQRESLNRTKESLRQEVRKCINNLNQAYSTIGKYKTITDGVYQIFLTDNDLICGNGKVEVMDDSKVIKIGNGTARVIWSSEINNQRAKINCTNPTNSNKTDWLDIYFL